LVRWKPDTGFYKDVRQRCGDYFKKKALIPFIKIWDMNLVAYL